MGQYKNYGQPNYLGFDRDDVAGYSFECSYCGKTFDRDEVLDLDNERCDECCSNVDIVEDVLFVGDDELNPKYNDDNVLPECILEAMRESDPDFE